MQRRNLLIGMGSLAAGGAATIGTGAFSAQASRSVDIDVVGDSSAYLGIDPYTSSEYVEESSPMSIDLASDSGKGGSGLAEMSDLAIVPAFDIQNQAGEDLYVEIDNPLANNDMTTAGGPGSKAVKGVDVQFLSKNTGSLPLKGDPAPTLIDRNSGTNSDPLGAEAFDLGSNGYWFHSLEGKGNSRGDRTTLQEGRSKSNQGALKIGSGETYPVVFRVIVREPTSEIPEESFRIESYSDKSNLDYDVANSGT